MFNKYQKGDLIRVKIPVQEQNKEFDYLVLDNKNYQNYFLLCLNDGTKNFYSKFYTDKAAVLVA